VLIERFSDILEVAAPNNKDKYITAAETYQIDVHTAAMVRAAEELLAVTRKLKQLWILSESKDEGREHNGVLDNPLEVGDVAKQLQWIIRKEITEDYDVRQQDNGEEGGEIQID